MSEQCGNENWPQLGIGGSKTSWGRGHLTHAFNKHWSCFEKKSLPKIKGHILENNKKYKTGTCQLECFDM